MFYNSMVYQFSSGAQSCPTLCKPKNRSTPGLPVHHHLPEFTQTNVHRVDDAIQPSHPLLSLLLLTSIFPSIKVFSNESALHIRWPKYWSFGFSTSPSNEYSGLIPFRMDWFDLLACHYYNQRKKRTITFRSFLESFCAGVCVCHNSDHEICPLDAFRVYNAVHREAQTLGTQQMSVIYLIQAVRTGQDQ